MSSNIHSVTYDQVLDLIKQETEVVSKVTEERLKHMDA